MSSELQRILDKISQYGQAGQVRARHDLARLRSPNPNPRIESYDQFIRVVGAFLNRQIEMTGGQRYPDFEARAMAKEILSRGGGQSGKTLNNFVRDAIDGRSGGLREALDIITDRLRDQQTSMFIADAIDQVVDPLDFDRKVEITRQVLAHFAGINSTSVQVPRPEACAHDYGNLLQLIARQVDHLNDSLRKY